MIVKIRHAKVTDKKRVEELGSVLGYINAESEESDQLEQVLDCPCHTVIVAEHNDAILGWMHIFYALRVASPSFYEIGGMAVAKEYQGKGVGKQLIKYAMQKYPGQWRVRCNESRTDTLAFYRSVGFEATKNQTVFSKTVE